jgi:hypothetical protein
MVIINKIQNIANVDNLRKEIGEGIFHRLFRMFIRTVGVKYAVKIGR